MKVVFMTGEMALAVPGVRRTLALWWGYNAREVIGPAAVHGMFATLCVGAKGRVVGLHFYELVGRSLDSKLTWVTSRHRRQGLGRRMWRASLRFTGAKKVWAYAASDDGAKFIRGMRSMLHVPSSFDLGAWDDEAPVSASA